MHTAKHSVTLLSTILFFLLACDEEESSPFNQSEIWACHHKLVWDSLRTKDSLIGEWEWEYGACPRTSKDAPVYNFDGLSIKFKLDNSVTVKENGKLTQTAKWKVVKGDADLFAIEVSPPVRQLHGRILFFEERVEFNNSIVNGCDNYFKRKK